MEFIEKLAMLVSLATSLGVAGFFVYTNYYYNPPLSNESEWEQLNQEAAKVINFKTLRLDNITTNLHSPKTRLRYVNLEVHIQPLQDKQIAQLEQKKPLIYDAILTVAGKKGPDQLNSLAGKILFENEIKHKINLQMARPLVKKIFFSVFVIQ